MIYVCSMDLFHTLIQHKYKFFLTFLFQNIWVQIRKIKTIIKVNKLKIKNSVL